MTKNLPRLTLLNLAIFVLVGGAALIAIIYLANASTNQGIRVVEEAVSDETTKTIKIITPDIVGAHALIWDVNNNEIIYEKDANVPYPIASITKILTAVVGLETINKDAKITIIQSDLDTPGDSGLILSEVWGRDDLIKYMLLESANDGAVAIARVALENSPTYQSIESMMTAWADKIGMQTTTIKNETGLDIIDGSLASNYASASDVVRLLYYFSQNYTDFAMSSGDHDGSFTTNLTTHYATSTNKLSDVLPHTSGAKTGFTSVAGGNLALIAEIGLNRPIYFVILGSSYEQRFSDVNSMYQYALEVIQNQT